MKFQDWKNLTKDERKKIQWAELPKRNKLAILFLGFAIISVLAIIAFPSDKSKEFESAISSKNMAYVIAQGFVKNNLKSPSTAEFPLKDFQCSLDSSNVYTVQSYVDSQNSLGAMLRSKWQVKLKYTGGEDGDPNNWSLIDIIIDKAP